MCIKGRNKCRYTNLYLPKSLKLLFRKEHISFIIEKKEKEKWQGQMLGHLRLGFTWLLGENWCWFRRGSGMLAISWSVGCFRLESLNIWHLFAHGDDNGVSWVDVFIWFCVYLRSFLHFLRFSSVNWYFWITMARWETLINGLKFMIGPIENVALGIEKHTRLITDLNWIGRYSTHCNRELLPT